MIAINGKEVDDVDENNDKKPGDIDDCWPMCCMKR